MATANSESKQKALKVNKFNTEVTADITAKITASYEKLSTKFREKAERASEHLKDAKSETKCATYRRKFELYGDAATDLDERVRVLKNGSDNGPD